MTTALALTEQSVDKLLKRPGATDQIKLSMSNSITPDAFFRAAYTALTKTPKLQKCTTASLGMALMDCAQVGLVLDGRLAHLIPYGTEAKLIVDWKGYVALGRRSGEISVWKAELVCENDVFSCDAISGILHSIDYRKPRGTPYAAYSFVRFKDGSEDWEVMTQEEIIAIRDRSPAGKSKDSPWQHPQDQYEMWKKSPIRRHAKRLPLGGDYKKALDRDFDSPLDITGDIGITPLTRPESTATPPVEEKKAEPPAPKKDKTREKKDKPKKDNPALAAANRGALGEEDLLPEEREAIVTALAELNIPNGPSKRAKAAIEVNEEMPVEDMDNDQISRYYLEVITKAV